MRKLFPYYLLVWIVLVAAFNGIAFLLAAEALVYSPSFWIGYALFMVSAVGFLIISIFAFRAETPDQGFLKLPLVHICWWGMIINGIVGIVFMLLPFLPVVIGGIICIVDFAVCLILAILAIAGGSMVKASEKDLKGKMKVIPSLTMEANGLLAAAPDETAMAAKQVYEAFRYSDPKSSQATAQIESEIVQVFSGFKKDVAAGHREEAETTANQLLMLIRNRNNLCIASK